MLRLICAFVVRIWNKQVFSWHGSYQWNSAKHEILVIVSLNTGNLLIKTKIAWSPYCTVLWIKFWFWPILADTKSVETYQISFSLFLYTFKRFLIFFIRTEVNQTVSWEMMPDLSRLVLKPTKWHVCPAKTQISLGIRPVWSESLLSAWRKLGSLATHCVHTQFVGSVMSWLIC